MGGGGECWGGGGGGFAVWEHRVVPWGGWGVSCNYSTQKPDLMASLFNRGHTSEGAGGGAWR